MRMWGGRCCYPDCTHYDGENLPNGTIIRLEAHHGLCHDTIPAHSRWPLLVESLINLFPLCNLCHPAHPNYMLNSDHHNDAIEKYLQNLKDGGGPLEDIIGGHR